MVVKHRDKVGLAIFVLRQSGGARSHAQRSVPPRSCCTGIGFRLELLFTASPHIRSDAWSVPRFRMLAVRKPRGWDPSTRRHLCWPEGGTVTIHPAQTAARAATLAFAKILTLQS